MSAVMAEQPRIAATVVDDWIRVWRIARLSKGTAQGWPSVSVMYRIKEMGRFSSILRGRYGSRILSLFSVSTLEKDANIVQKIINQMPSEMRSAFEAYHLAVIRGDRCPRFPHKARAATLGIPSSTYFTRVDAGWKFLSQRLPAE